MSVIADCTQAKFKGRAKTFPLLFNFFSEHQEQVNTTKVHFYFLWKCRMSDSKNLKIKA